MIMGVTLDRYKWGNKDNRLDCQLNDTILVID